MKISVIVPVYNAEKYIEKCIDSVMHQTYGNWEMILVDDGSKDRSSQFIDEVARKDQRIITIHKKNEGPGIARNIGIEKATGDYIVFLDSDDYIDKDYFQLLIPKAKNNDVVFIDVNQISPNGKILSEEKMSVYKNWSKDRLLRSQMTGKIPWGGVRKAVSLKLLKENQIKYTAHSIGEEALYSFRILYAASTIEFIDKKAVYYYVNHENSQSKLKIADPWGEVVECVKRHIEEMGIYDEFANTLNAFNITATVVSFDKIQQMYKGSERNRIASNRIFKFNQNYDKNYGIDKKNMSFKARIFIPCIKRGLYSPIFLCSSLKTILR